MGSHAIASKRDDADGALDREETATEIMNAIRRVVRALRVGAQRAEADLGLSSAQVFVLQMLATATDASIAELAARTSTDPSSVSVVVSRLVARGWVERRTSPTDARRASLALTRAGRALLRKAPAMPQTHLLTALHTLADRDIRALQRGLGALVTAMGESAAPPPMFFEESEARPRAARPTRVRTNVSTRTTASRKGSRSDG
jgi:DNA-binding MarR family transcriptional regulator